MLCIALYYIIHVILYIGVVKRNPLFLHEIEWKNNGFFFTTPNTYILTKDHWIAEPIFTITLRCYDHRSAVVTLVSKLPVMR